MQGITFLPSRHAKCTYITTIHATSRRKTRFNQQQSDISAFHFFLPGEEWTGETGDDDTVV